jgi:hypothetical protein
MSQFRRIATGIALCIASVAIQSGSALAQDTVMVRPAPFGGWSTEQVATTTAAAVAPGTAVVGVPVSRRWSHVRRVGATRPNAGGYYYYSDGYRVFLVGPGNRVLVNGINVGDSILSYR